MTIPAAIERPAIPAPAPLVPTSDARPVELAIADSIAAGMPPETFLWITFHRPDGGATVRYAWTPGGVPLGDRIDGLALAAGLDSADWLHISSQHSSRTERGRIATTAYALRPILADVTAGVRAPDDLRAHLRRVIENGAAKTGRTALPGLPRWIGVGPVLLNRKAP